MENFGAEGLQGVAAVPLHPAPQTRGFAMMGPALTFDIVGRSTRFGRDGYWRRNVHSGFPVGTLTTSWWNVSGGGRSWDCQPSSPKEDGRR